MTKDDDVARYPLAQPPRREEVEDALTAANQRIAELEGANAILQTEVGIVASVPVDAAMPVEKNTLGWLKARARAALDAIDPNLNGYLRGAAEAAAASMRERCAALMNAAALHYTQVQLHQSDPTRQEAERRINERFSEVYAGAAAAIRDLPLTASPQGDDGGSVSPKHIIAKSETTSPDAAAIRAMALEPLNTVYDWFVRECAEPDPSKGEVVERSARGAFDALCEALGALASQAPAGDGWRPMEAVPLNTPVEVRMPYTKGGWWVATAEVDEIPEPYDDAGDRYANILHYNGTSLVGLFRGPLHSWRPLPAPPVVKPGTEVA